MTTRTGTVKRITLDSINTARKAGIRCITLEEGDELISVRKTDGSQNILLCTHDGMAICFKENDVRCMGRDAVGVRGIKLKDGDWVVGGEVCSDGDCLLTVTENGYGKRTPLEDYLRGEGGPQNRGGMGLKNYNITDKTGKIADVKMVTDEDDIMIISDDGTILRTGADGVNIYSRVTQGVKIMNVADGVKVISLAKTEKEEEEPDENGEAEVVEETQNEVE